MTMTNFKIPQGNSWNPSIAITEDGTAKNCASHSCKLVIKKGFEESLDTLYTLVIAWISQSGGTGSFNLTNAQSKALTAGLSYAYEGFLYKSDGSYNKTVCKGILYITDSLDKDVT